MDLIIDKVKQVLTWIVNHPFVGIIIGAILIFIGGNQDGSEAQSGKGILILLGIVIIVVSLGAFSLFRIWG